VSEQLDRVRSEALAASGTLAFHLLALAAAGVKVPIEVVRAQQTIAAWLTAAPPPPPTARGNGGGEAIESNG
jgi:hypothetical protein